VILIKQVPKIVFISDPEIFIETREFCYDIVAKCLNELAFLHAGITITIAIDNECNDKPEVFNFEMTSLNMSDS
jgi:DNA gyrase/topoisomerase IV subunit B